MIRRGINIQNDYIGPRLRAKAFTGLNTTPDTDEFNYSDKKNTAVILDAIAQAIWKKKAEEERLRNLNLISPYVNLSFYNSKFKRGGKTCFFKHTQKEETSKERSSSP